MINKSFFGVIAIAVVFASMVSIFSLPAVVVTAQQQQQQNQIGVTDPIVNPNTNNSKSYLFGCNDGVVIFENNGNLKMGCVNAPFQFHAFNGTDAKTYQNTPSPIHINVQKICTDLHLDKKVCAKLPKSVP